MNSKITFILAALLTFSLSSHAGNQEVLALKNEFQQLRYDVPTERERGMSGIEKVFAALAKFGAKKSNLKNKADFADIVAMVGAALPFDGETESAGVIVDFIHDRKDLRSVYESTVQAMTDKCRQQFIRTVVSERECGLKLKDDAAPDACVSKPVFLYSTCIGMKMPE